MMTRNIEGLHCPNRSASNKPPFLLVSRPRYIWLATIKLDRDITKRYMNYKNDNQRLELIKKVLRSLVRLLVYLGLS